MGELAAASKKVRLLDTRSEGFVTHPTKSSSLFAREPVRKEGPPMEGNPSFAEPPLFKSSPFVFQINF